MYINLYYMSTENNRMDKTNYLRLIKQLNGTFRDSVSVINPIFTIEYDSSFIDFNHQVLQCNYVYIPLFKRYYFVTNIIAVTTKLWEIHCAVDVLMSFKTELGELDVFCERNEYNYNDLLIDDKVPSNNNDIINYYYSGLSSPFHNMDRNSSTTCCIVSTAGYEEKPLTNSNELRVPYINYYCFPIAQFNNFCNTLFNPFDVDNMAKRFFVEPSECFRSATIYPFNPIDYIDESLGTERTIKMGNQNIELNAISNRIPNKRLLHITVNGINIPNYYNNFLDYEPYTFVQAFVPFLGYVSLPTDIVMGKRISLSYILDIETGEATVSISTATSIEPVFLDKVQLGYVIPTVKTNSSAQLMSIFSAICSFATGALTGGAGLAIGALSAGASLAKNYQGYAHSPKKGSDLNAFRKNREEIIGSAKFNAVSEITNFISSNTVNVINSLKQKTLSCSGGNNVASMSSFYDFFVRVVRPNAYYPTGYNHLVGKPSKFTGKLKNLNGYTELSGFHIEGIPNCTMEEQSEINSILRSGFLMPDP